MNNKEIDKLIKDKLAESPANMHTADWHVFSQLLKKAEGFEDFDTDKVIAEKVSTHTVAYNESHWQLLKERLVKEENLRKKLFTSKAIESILILLLLLLFQNYDKNLFEQKIAHDLKEAVAAGNEIQSRAYNHNSTALVKDGIEVEKAQSQSSEELTTDVFAFAHSVEAYSNTASPGPIAKVDAMNDYDAVNELQPLSYIQSSVKKEAELLSIASQHNDFSPNNAFDDFNTNMPGAFEQSIGSPTQDAMNASHKKQKFLTASIAGGLGIAKSGYDPIYKINGYSTYSSQYGIGLLYSVKNNRYEVQTGLRYSKKKYEPNKLTEIYGNLYSGYREISLDKISYDIVDIPVSVKYFLNEGKKTSFFVKAGVNASFSLANKYTVATSTIQSNANAASEVQITDSKQIDRLSKLSQKEFIPGLLQKSKSHGIVSTIGENSFFTVSAEIGAETKITKDDALVLGLEYNKYYKVDGIGPNKDRLSALTINFGLKHCIN